MAGIGVIENYKSRFQDAEWLVPQEIIVGGLGGIGNGVCTELTKLGHTLYIYEFDTVEYYNCIPQGYNIDQIGMKKFDAFKQNVSRATDKVDVYCEGKYEKDSMASQIMFSCFDNMQARKDMFNNWAALEDKKVFMDGRLLAEVFQVFVVTPNSVDRYMEFLFDDSEVEEEPCTYKQTSHVSKMLHGYMVNMLNSYIVNTKYGMEVRPIPFYSEYNAALNMWNYDN